MATAALALAVLALLVALLARAKAGWLAQQLDDARTDARRRAENLAEELEAQHGLVREMLARVASGDGLTPEMIRDGQLWKDVTPAEGQSLLAAGGLRILDVRSPQETAGGVLPGATLIPIDQLEARLDEIPRDGAATLVYCAAGGRSAAACEFLSSQGFRGLHNLTGGIGAWPGDLARPE